MQGIPIIKTKLYGSRQFFHCKYCRKRHSHALGTGHFNAHENCPYKKTGYWLTSGKESSIS